MNIHFVLRNTFESKTGLRQIQLVYCANNRQIKLDTSIRVRIKDWNDSKQQILSSVSEIGKTSKELNDKLNEKKKKVLTIVSEFKKEHENGTSISPDPDIIFVHDKFHEVVKEIKIERTVLEHLQEYINDRKSMIDTVHNGLHKDKRSGQYKTLSHYESLYNDLVKFSEKTRKTYHFCDIDKKFKDNLIKFYLDKGSKKEKNFTVPLKDFMSKMLLAPWMD
jgi:hypothetical protein